MHTARTTVTGALCAGLVAVTLLSACARRTTAPLAPAMLDAKVLVTDNEPSPADQKVLISVAFAANGEEVKLGSDAIVTANGVALPWNGVAYMGRVPMVATGARYELVLGQGATQTQIASVVVPARPVILSPAPDAEVTRTHDLVVTYTASGGTHVDGGAQGKKPGASAVMALTGSDQTDDGTYGPINCFAFEAGPGEVWINREHKLTPGVTGLRSVAVTYNTGNDVHIVWR